jgi:hypothetical protein
MGLIPGARRRALCTRVMYFLVCEKVYGRSRHLGIIPATLGRIQGGFTMAAQTEEQLRKALAEAQAKLNKIAKKKKRGEGWKPSFDGQHRGY